MIKNFNLIKELTLSDFKLRYKGSLLGLVWSFLKPLLMLLTFYVVFSLIIKLEINNYVLFLFLGIILWNFFADSTVLSMNNLLSKRDLIKKVYFPREILVISSCLNAFLNLLFSLFIFIFFLFLFKIEITIYFLLFIPILISLFILSLGFSYLLSSLYVKYRDLDHLWGIVLSIGFWITPIAYSIDFVPKNYLTLYMLNPFARIITDSRDILIYNKIDSIWSILITFLISIAIYLLGYYVYKKRSLYFAEEL